MQLCNSTHAPRGFELDTHFPIITSAFIQLSLLWVLLFEYSERKNKAIIRQPVFNTHTCLFRCPSFDGSFLQVVPTGSSMIF